MNINTTLSQLEQNTVRHAPNDAARDLQTKDKYEKKVSATKSEEIRRDKTESTNETDKQQEVDPTISKEAIKRSKSSDEEEPKTEDLGKIRDTSTNITYGKTDEGERVTKILNKDGDMLRQIPSEVALRVYRDITSYLDRQNNNEGDNNESV